ncbi:hypothetical protein niasHS_011261 [Heterodera schachtii]|uniref:Uncharacterized protein n=1 Tax=Heterodera schachtii TaxID=97005 RepID=A0ABD2ITZ2_HETSC
MRFVFFILLLQFIAIGVLLGAAVQAEMAFSGEEPPSSKRINRERQRRGHKLSGAIAGGLIGTGAAVGLNAYQKNKAKNGSNVVSRLSDQLAKFQAPKH